MSGKKDEEAQALVETAVAMLLFALIILGAAEFGQLAFAAMEVSDAANAAAQYGSQSSYTAADSAGMLAAARNEYISPSALTVSSAYACSCAGSGTSTSCTNNSLTNPACPGSYMEITVTIQTQASYTPPIHIPGLSGPFTLNGAAKRKVLQ
ncbi:MAG TPA: TadE/TadG family type IV pilus assembly protein [Acidobacteriaceae bacterium]|nr:TadE/TadG family type IV pilus assembly protein [Acidobacteriaceae bacterium]